MSKQKSRPTDGNNKRNNKGQRGLALAVLLLILAGSAWFGLSENEGIARLRNSLFNQNGVEQGDPDPQTDPSENEYYSLDPDDLPEFSGEHYVTVNNNVPLFPREAYEDAGLVEDNGKWKTEGNLFGTVDSRKLISYEYYGELDNLGRCTVAYGCLSEETMPPDDEKRGDISSIHPSGWAKAQNWERSHLIAWKLSGENANERNLVTGTHYMNHDGMRPVEEEVEHYIWDTGNHVLYLARPIFKGRELVPRGVQMMAYSVEDHGEGMSFNIYCFNVTPGAQIDYMTGIVTTKEQAEQGATVYVLNTRSGVFHYPSCEGAQSISARNRKEVTATRVEMTERGYTPCGACQP